MLLFMIGVGLLMTVSLSVVAGAMFTGTMSGKMSELLKPALAVGLAAGLFIFTKGLMSFASLFMVNEEIRIIQVLEDNRLLIYEE